LGDLLIFCRILGNKVDAKKIQKNDACIISHVL